MNKTNILIIIGIILGMTTTLLIVDKVTSVNNQELPVTTYPSEKGISIPKTNQYVGSNQYALIKGYKFIGGGKTGDYYFKEGSGKYESLPEGILFGGVIMVERKNQPSEVYKIYVDFGEDCKNGYGALYQYKVSGGFIGKGDWVSGSNTINDGIGEFLCYLGKLKN